jgi:hypothetical protein
LKHVLHAAFEASHGDSDDGGMRSGARGAWLRWPALARALTRAPQRWAWTVAAAEERAGGGVDAHRPPGCVERGIAAAPHGAPLALPLRLAAGARRHGGCCAAAPAADAPAAVEAKDVTTAAHADAAQAAYDADVAGARRGRRLRAVGMLALYACWCAALRACEDARIDAHHLSR